jgi:hypothetical protein
MHEVKRRGYTFSRTIAFRYRADNVFFFLNKLYFIVYV